jgi:hypothetical protein
VPITYGLTVVKKTAHGSSTVSFSHSVSHPSALRLQSVATARAWTHWMLSCTSGGSIKSSSRTWRPYAGTTTKALPMGFAHPSFCQVSVSLGYAGLRGTIHGEPAEAVAQAPAGACGRSGYSRQAVYG